jgi:hypothetical protein
MAMYQGIPPYLPEIVAGVVLVAAYFRLRTLQAAQHEALLRLSALAEQRIAALNTAEKQPATEPVSGAPGADNASKMRDWCRRHPKLEKAYPQLFALVRHI